MKVYEAIIKEYGEGILRTGLNIIENPKEIVPVSPNLDIILGGGILEGSFCILSGPPKCGKTVTALQIAKNAQRQGRNVHILDVEARLKSRDLLGIEGLDAAKINVVGSFRQENESKILSGEENLRIAEKLIKDDPRSVIIIDSVSQLCVEKEMTEDIGKDHRSPHTKLLAQFCRKISNILPINNNIVVCVSHLISDTSGKTWGGYIESGGNKIKYAVDVHLRAKYFTKWKVGGEDSEQIGQKVKWTTISTSIIAPGKEIESYIRYGIGIDEMMELVETGTLLGLIKKSGAWYSIGEIKAQGKEKLIAALNENPEAKSNLQQEVREILVG